MSATAPGVDPFAATGMASPHERSPSAAPARSNAQSSNPSAGFHTSDIGSYSSTRNPQARSRLWAYSVGIAAAVVLGSLMALWMAKEPIGLAAQSPEAGALAPEGSATPAFGRENREPQVDAARHESGGAGEHHALTPSPPASSAALSSAADASTPRRRDPRPARSAIPNPSIEPAAIPEKPPPLVPP
jgi:hypothetical protein